MQNLLHDMRYTLRQLRRSPGFALTALVTLTLGIGATTAMYSIVRSTLLAPLPYPHPNELVGIGFSHPGEPANDEQTGETADFILDRSRSFSSLGVADDGPLGANFSNGSGVAQTIRSLRVSSGYLPTLGVPPLLGRSFTREEDLPGAESTVVLSENFWRHSLNADPRIINRVVQINGDPFTVIGVMPATLATVDSPDLWQPLHLSSADPGYDGDNYQMLGRLKPGFSIQQAAAELTSLTPAIYRQFPDYKRWVRPGVPLAREFLWSLQQVIVSNARSSLVALSAAVLAVLLMVCLNLAGLMTARCMTRRSEIALRMALGAGRTAILRLLLTESLLLAIAGSLLGLLLAWIAVPVLLTSSPIALPHLVTSAIDFPVAAFAVLIGCVATLFFGLVPALEVFRKTISSHIGNVRTVSDSLPSQRFGKSLIVAQVAVATLLLSAGALLMSTFLHMRSIPSGVRPQHLYALQVNLKGSGYASATRSQQFIADVEERLRRIPGVAQVAAVNGLPLDRGLNAAAGPADRPNEVRNSEVRYITPGYFRTVQTMLLDGSDVSDADTAHAQPVALINDLGAKRWFPNRSAIGEYVVAGGGKPIRVIGIVANVRNMSLADAIRPTVYLPYAQASDETMKAINGWFATTFVIRTIERGETRDPNIAAAASAAVNAVDPEVPVSKFAPMQSLLDDDVAAPRFFSWLAGSFAVFALLLTLIGLFGLLSYQVASRTRELGVRMALGAQRSQILSMVLNSGLVLTSAGLVIGIAGSFALRNLVAGFVSNTVGIAPSTATALLGNRALAIAIAGAAMLLSAIAASLIPARRAAILEPMEALRTE